MPRLASITGQALTGLGKRIREALITLVNPNAFGTEQSDDFGRVVATNGDYVVVSAPLEDTATVSGAGKVYVFDKFDGSLLYTLTSPNPTGFISGGTIPSFGCALSISGTNLLVGARYDSTDGRVYVYDLTTGSLSRTIQTSLSTGYTIRDFGFSLDAWGDYLIVGSHNTNYSFNQEVGFAELFSISTGSSLRVFLNPASSANYAYDNFGETVAIHGTRVLIGSAYDDISATNAGRAYLFDRDSGTLLNTFIDSSPVSNGRFGTYLDINDSYITIYKNSTRTVYVYDANSPWSLLYTINRADFINPVFVSRFYEDKFIVGSRASDSEGVGFLYDLSSDTPTAYTTAISSPLGQVDSFFGLAAAIDADTVVIGAPLAVSDGGALNSGKAVVYNRSAIPVVPPP